MSSRSITKMTSEADIRGSWSMLQTRRPGGSKSERRFIRDFLMPLGVEMDGMGNLYKKIGNAPILWSAHTDTVHKEGGIQKIRLCGDKIILDPSSKSNCLGADNTAGIWMLTEMMRAGKEGLYVFHRYEESGGVGSDHFAKNQKAMLEGIQCAIAFDRKKTQSVITHQWSGRTCSDDFAKSLASAIDLKYQCDDGGSFTDTANYTDVIGECTNLSIGFENEHTDKESLTLSHVLSLREAMLKVSADQLVFKRAPGEEDPTHWMYELDCCDWRSDYGRPYGSNSRSFRDFPHVVMPPTAAKDKRAWEWDDDEYENELSQIARNWTIGELCREYPEEVGDYLESIGIDEEYIIDHIVQLNGAVVRKR